MAARCGVPEALSCGALAILILILGVDMHALYLRICFDRRRAGYAAVLTEGYVPHQRPQPDEYAPHQKHYIDLVPDSVLDALREQCRDIERVLLSISGSDADYRYEPAKWSIRQVSGHLSDAERVYGYRALALARNDNNPLPKYDPDGYVNAAGFDTRSMDSLVGELLALRQSTIRFFEGLPLDAWSRRGSMGGNPLSVRALAFIAVGHVRQHLNVLHERYGVPR